MIQTDLDVLRDISLRLDAAGIAFMLTGSVAMNQYAQPRMTRDIDIVVMLNDTDAATIVELFEPDYYVPIATVARAIARRSMFNLIHNESVFKVDFIVLKDDPYRQEEFARRRQVTIEDFQIWVVSREDLILSKLVWAKDSKSEMQLRDVKNLLTPECDMEYLTSRATQLDVIELLNEVMTKDAKDK